MSKEAHTVHIGTLTSGVTVGQLAVRANTLRWLILVLIIRFARSARLDAAHLDAKPGPLRASLRGYQGRHRQPPSRSQNVLEQRYVLSRFRSRHRKRWRLTVIVRFYRRLLYTRPRSGEPRPPRRFLREVPRLRGQNFPIREGNQIRRGMMKMNP